ncbi:hypothetical protein B296_00028274 [Ensete ventricosum]|uniref:Uncharacterized protein n=1 Tax=Ensete ventricosum TaxID=4639 RepID=A0A426Y970_ENSVE|nr:hypothetical protein B296_00028274 [Ensete ventricosum]
MICVPIWFELIFVLDEVVHGVCAALATDRSYMYKVDRTYARSIIPGLGTTVSTVSRRPENGRRGSEASVDTDVKGGGASGSLERDGMKTGLSSWTEDRLKIFDHTSRAEAYIVGVVDHLYLATRLPMWLTLSSYASTMPAVLAPLVRGGPELVPSGGSGTLNGAGADPTERELENWNGAGADLIERELGNLNGAGAREFDARADPTEQELGNCDARADPTEQELGNCDVARATEQELGNCDVARADPTEQELGNCDVARGDPTEQELGNCDVARGDPTEQELGNYDVARADLTEQELGNCDARADPTEQELENCDVARADLTKHELGNCDVARADPIEQELGNCDVARADPTEQELGNCEWLLPRVNSGTNPEIWPRG